MAEERMSAFMDIDGKEHFFEEVALAQLIDDDVVFISGQCMGKREPIKLFVGHSDVFYWACSDGEDLFADDLETLYRMHMADKEFGVTRWAALRRNMRPQWPVVKEMIESGKWDSELDALPKRTDGGDHSWTPDREREATEAATKASGTTD